MNAKRWIVSGIAIIILVSASGTLAQDVQKLNINFASSEELQNLSGIGPKLAEAIIASRPYANVEDLLNVKGIGEKKLADIQDLIIVEKFNVNTATLEELLILPEMDQELAEAIIKGRPYMEVEDLLNVKEMDEDVLEELENYIEAELEKEEEENRGRKSRSKKTGSDPDSTNPNN